MHKRVLALLIVMIFAKQAHAQHLWWNLDGQTQATCVYGEITVLATYPHIYYCGANWHPGEPAGGYCGIQDNELNQRRTIFSIWDTSDTLHPKATANDPRTITGRFGGEGEGGHTHMPWPWKTGETFQFCVTKSPGKTPDTTDTRYYIFDRDKKSWIQSATINNPIGGHDSVATISGGMNSFLENFAGKDKDIARLATYRLWLGTKPSDLKPLTRAGGDGQWGELNDCYFLANGSTENLDKVFAANVEKCGKPTWGEKGQTLPPISEKPIDKKTIKQLEKITKASDR